MKPKNAMDYFHEMNDLEKSISSIQQTLEYLQGAIVKASEVNDDSQIIEMTLALAESDLVDAKKSFLSRLELIQDKFENSFF